MTREKIKNHIIAGLIGPENSATVSAIALDALGFLPNRRSAERSQWVMLLAYDLCCTVTEWEDDGFLFLEDPVRTHSEKAEAWGLNLG